MLDVSGGADGLRRIQRLDANVLVKAPRAGATAGAAYNGYLIRLPFPYFPLHYAFMTLLLDTPSCHDPQLLGGIRLSMADSEPTMIRLCLFLAGLPLIGTVLFSQNIELGYCRP